jgi:hypothetical protein
VLRNGLFEKYGYCNGRAFGILLILTDNIKTGQIGYTLILTFSLKGEGMAKCSNRGNIGNKPFLSPTRERLGEGAQTILQ